jgi:hypothetical protein
MEGCQDDAACVPPKHHRRPPFFQIRRFSSIPTRGEHILEIPSFPSIRFALCALPEPLAAWSPGDLKVLEAPVGHDPPCTFLSRGGRRPLVLC